MMLRRRVDQVREYFRFFAVGSFCRDRLRCAAMGLYHTRTLKDAPRAAKIDHLVPNGLVAFRPRVLKGRSVTIDAGDWTQVEIFRELFVLDVYDLSAVPFAPDLIIDCGGHVGLFSVLAAVTYPGTNIMTFEPNPRNLELIRRQISDNQLPVTVVSAAVSDSAREQWFTIPASPGGRLENEQSEPGDRICVKVVDLREYLQRAKPRRLLLKMDVEGEEMRILPSVLGQLPRETALFFETHDGPRSWESISRLLSDAGFTVSLLRERDPYRDGFALRGAS